MGTTINGANPLVTQDPNKTSRGTTIVKNGNQMDKNAFLRILTAELSNQDPDNTKDSTEYIAQMAQFSSLEQMSNLNSNIQLSSANSMIGKMVSLSDLDPNGNPYVGTVKTVSKQGSSVKIGVEVDNNGNKEMQDFSFDDVTGVTANPDDVTNVNNDAMNFLAEASIIGKKAEFNVKDANGNNSTGTITGIVKNNGVYSLNVLLDGTTTTKQFDPSSLISLTNGN